MFDFLKWNAFGINQFFVVHDCVLKPLNKIGEILFQNSLDFKWGLTKFIVLEELIPFGAD